MPFHTAAALLLLGAAMGLSAVASTDAPARQPPKPPAVLYFDPLPR